MNLYASLPIVQTTIDQTIPIKKKLKNNKIIYNNRPYKKLFIGIFISKILLMCLACLLLIQYTEYQYLTIILSIMCYIYLIYYEIFAKNHNAIMHFKSLLTENTDICDIHIKLVQNVKNNSRQFIKKHFIYLSLMFLFLIPFLIIISIISLIIINLKQITRSDIQIPISMQIISDVWNIISSSNILILILVILLIIIPMFITIGAWFLCKKYMYKFDATYTLMAIFQKVLSVILIAFAIILLIEGIILFIVSYCEYGPLSWLKIDVLIKKILVYICKSILPILQYFGNMMGDNFPNLNNIIDMINTLMGDNISDSVLDTFIDFAFPYKNKGLIFIYNIINIIIIIPLLILLILFVILYRNHITSDMYSLLLNNYNYIQSPYKYILIQILILFLFIYILFECVLNKPDNFSFNTNHIFYIFVAFYIFLNIIYMFYIIYSIISPSQIMINKQLLHNTEL